LGRTASIDADNNAVVLEISDKVSASLVSTLRDYARSIGLRLRFERVSGSIGVKT
jgi:hypothetical protein